MEQLAETFGIMVQADTDISAKRNQLQLDGERIYSDMDVHNMGFISINSFANWICDNCGFHINDDDLPGLETVLDGSNDYRITREGFIETVSVPPDDEEGDNLGASFKASATPNKSSLTKQQRQGTNSSSKFGANNSAAKMQASANKA